LTLEVVKREGRKWSIPIGLIVLIVMTAIGFLEGGISGAVFAFVSGILAPFFGLLGLIPFAGPYLYLLLWEWWSSLTIYFNVNTPIALMIGCFYGFIVSVLICLVTSIVAVIAFGTLLKKLVG